MLPRCGVLFYCNTVLIILFKTLFYRFPIVCLVCNPKKKKKLNYKKHTEKTGYSVLGVARNVLVLAVLLYVGIFFLYLLRNFSTSNLVSIINFKSSFQQKILSFWCLVVFQIMDRIKTIRKNGNRTITVFVIFEFFFVIQLKNNRRNLQSPRTYVTAF